MNKVKIVKSKGISQLMIKSLKGQQLSEHEVYSINKMLLKKRMPLNFFTMLPDM